MAIIAVSPRIARPLVCLGLLFAAGFSGLTARGFGAVATPQITGPINNQQRVTLHGNVRPLPASKQDLGAAPANLPTGRVQLLLKRPAEQQAELTQFLEDVQRPGSVVYHQWLTPAQLGAQYGPAEADVQAVAGWLASQGFAVGKVNQARTAIEFSGTVGQIERTFATQIHSFTLQNGESHVSNITDPQIPAALAPVVAGLSPLNDFRPKPMHAQPTAHLAEAAPTSTNPHAFAVRPDFTHPDSTGALEYFVTPGDLATIYNIPNSTLNTHFAAAASLDGSGVHIGVAGVSNIDSIDVADYRGLFGLPQLLPTIVIDGNDPGVQGDNAVEALLDLEQLSAVAPRANLTLYISQDATFQFGLNLAIQRALDDNLVSILNVSFGGCEAYQGQAGNQQVLNYWQQAAAQGITVTVSSGDSDSAGCDNENFEASAAQGLQVNGLASTPYNIAVGGTDFNQTSATASQFWSTTNSGIFESALGPIPEIPWNDSTTTIGGFAGNVPTQEQGSTNIVGGGGGLSGCLNGTVDGSGNVLACAGAYGVPTFQSGFGSGTTRQLPDVALFAANGFHRASYLLCASGLGNDQPGQTDCVGGGATFGFQGVGGTSAASPVFAGMLALVSQSQGGARLGQADFTLYPLSKQHPAAFHDIATGNNSPVCTPGTLNCGSNSFLVGYNAATGYDLATGLGSVDATQLVANWASITFHGTNTALQLNGSTAPLTITHGTAVPVTVTVSGTGGTPTGNVALVNNSSTPGAAVAAVQGSTASASVFSLSSGSASGSDAFLPGGTYTVQANYAGDGVFGASTSNAVSVTVNPEASTLDFSVLDFDINGNGSLVGGGSFPYGSLISVSATPVSTAKASSTTVQALATGLISFSSTSPLLNQADPINSSGFAEIANTRISPYPPGSYSVSASYSGDPSFTASSAPAQSFSIVKADNFFLPVAFPSASALTVEVDPNIQQFFTTESAVQPTGTVTVTNSSGATIGTGTLQISNSGAAQATINVSQLSGTIGIAYAGDGNYNAPANVACSLGQIALCVPSGNFAVPRGTSATALVSLTPQTADGTSSLNVNLSCSVGSGSGVSPTCAFSQSSGVLNGPAIVGLTISAATNSAAHIPAAPHASKIHPLYAAGGAGLAGLLLLGLPRRRRAWQRMLSLLVVVCALGFVGCGGGSSKSSSSGGSGSGAPAGTYVVTVTAVAGSATQTNTLTVVVQ
jgi:Pro-kumamolisin, activation domain/Bacterial Ig-like domain (group 3)